MTDNKNYMGAGTEQVNPFEYPSVVCEECGNQVFQPALIFKKVPGILLGQGTEDVSLPVKVTCCSKCGALSPHDRTFIEEQEKTVKQAKSPLII